jgi:hypothetical protein
MGSDVTHVYHGDLGMPEGTLFYDGCPECEARAAQGVRGLLTQTPDRVRMMWDRMVHDEHSHGVEHDKTLGYHSKCEERIGRDLYAFAVLLERAGHREAWTILSTMQMAGGVG